MQAIEISLSDPFFNKPGLMLLFHLGVKDADQGAPRP
jgi:hypothetical protein